MLIAPANLYQPWKRLKSFGFAVFTIDDACIIWTFSPPTRNLVFIKKWVYCLIS